MRLRNKNLSPLLALAAAAGAGLLTAQSQAPQNQPGQPPAAQQGQQQDEDFVIRADTRLVVLHATVVDRSGNPVNNLPQSAFRVLENGVPQEIKKFVREDVPVSMGLVVDNSGSMRDMRRPVEESALTLVKSSNPEDEVFIVNYNDDAWLDVPFTNKLERMEEGLTRIDARGGTAMRDALSMSMDYINKEAKKDKKVLVVITDGNDNTSTTTLERLLSRGQQSEVLIYTIGLLSSEDKREAKKAKRALEALANATGGNVFFPQEVGEVQNVARRIAQEVRNQYTIAYTPSNPELDGSYRQVKLAVQGRSGIQVRTRSGYYATRDQKPPQGSTPVTSPPPSGRSE